MSHCVGSPEVSRGQNWPIPRLQRMHTLQVIGHYGGAVIIADGCVSTAFQMHDGGTGRCWHAVRRKIHNRCHCHHGPQTRAKSDNDIVSTISHLWALGGKREFLQVAFWLCNVTLDGTGGHCGTTGQPRS